MPKLTAKGLKWLKGFHLLAVACWVGGGVSLMLLYFIKDGVSDGGVLYGILKGWTVEKCAQFGWATGALAATSHYDYGMAADEKQVWDLWKGNARVQR